MKTYDNVDIITLGLQSGLKIATTLPDGKLTIQGSQLSLEALKPEQIRLVVDLSTVKSPGLYTVPARPDLPRDFVVLNFDPAQVTLLVTEENGTGDTTTE